MDPISVRDAFEALLRTDIAVAERDELAEAIGTVSRLRAWLDARELACVRRSCTLAEQGRCEARLGMLYQIAVHAL